MTSPENPRQNDPQHRPAAEPQPPHHDAAVSMPSAGSGTPVTGGSSGPGSPVTGGSPGPGSPPVGSSGSSSPGSSVSGSSSSNTTDVAKEQGKQVAEDAKESGKQVAEDAKESGKQVAQTAQEEARQVASTVSDQARSLFHEATTEVNRQAGGQQQRLAENLRSLSQEFGAMAEGSSDSSTQATGLVREVSQRTQGLADWLEQREPGDVLEEVKRFARRKPGTFIAVAAGIGLLAGRMTRGLTADDQGAGSSGATGPASRPAPVMAGTGTASGAQSRPPIDGPVDPGPMSGIGAGPTGGYGSETTPSGAVTTGAPTSGGPTQASHPAAPASPGVERDPVYGDDPR